MSVQTETLDKLYLEWSQFTGARTEREIRMFKLLEIAASTAKMAKASGTRLALPAFFEAEFEAIKKLYGSL